MRFNVVFAVPGWLLFGQGCVGIKIQAGSEAVSQELAELDEVENKETPPPVMITSAEWAQASAYAPPNTAPCECEFANPAWEGPKRTDSRCFFFDLGAADGETFKVFLGQSQKWTYSYNTTPFHPKQCAAYLFEPNPVFQTNLREAVGLNPNLVVPLSKEAVYMCDKDDEEFFLDATISQAWGSSLDTHHASVANSEKVPVKVKLVNLLRVLKQMTLPQDTVVVKMDIEGAEYDVIPCLAKAPEIASLIDHMYFEQHCPNGNLPGQWCASQGQAGNSLNTFRAALDVLRKVGVDVPIGYFSPM